MSQLARSTAARWSVAVAAIVICAWLAAVWWPSPAEAQLGGYSQVTRLEVEYRLPDGAVEARFHLASGIAVDQRIENDTAIERLHQAAQVFATGETRMFATVEKDRAVSWTLSVP